MSTEPLDTDSAEEQERAADSRADAKAICALLAIAMTTLLYFLLS